MLPCPSKGMWERVAGRCSSPGERTCQVVTSLHDQATANDVSHDASYTPTTALLSHISRNPSMSQ
ncbi:hypothetical protein SCLCIDRAFT_285663 [Scleroderma citrinum Foug A]|uniref:Uncharacterized protein n=1 Tax=Scleroderma citrinum Foug A TaxID=1036808 RepID=A0A0C3DI49_9AGAM|nr:hypothetical protein SCLCIDRAFT_285663 [Scleroderma citrinum Foug A]